MPDPPARAPMLLKCPLHLTSHLALPASSEDRARHAPPPLPLTLLGLVSSNRTSSLPLYMSAKCWFMRAACSEGLRGKGRMKEMKEEMKNRKKWRVASCTQHKRHASETCTSAGQPASLPACQPACLPACLPTRLPQCCAHLCVADVQVARGLRREAGDYLAHLRILQPNVKAARVCRER